MSSMIPKLWAAELRKRIFSKSVLEETFAPMDTLDPKDVWDGEDPGTYEEAVAWAKLLNVRVAKTRWGKDSRPDNLILQLPNAVPLWVGICSPTKLIEVIRAYAANPPTKGTVVTDAAAPPWREDQASPASVMFRGGARAVREDG